MDEKLSKNNPEPGYSEGLISALSIGAVFILIGLVFVINQNLWSNIVNFSNDLTSVKVASTSVFLPAPTDPSAHAALYMVTSQFELWLGILQVVILAARLLVHSRIRRIAQTVGSLVFWFGASYLTQTYLNSTTTQQTWFVFWATIIMLGGISLIVRAFVLLARKVTN